jgi:hypothetical protein
MDQTQRRKDAADFGFWILDFGLQRHSVTTQNPKSKIQNPKSSAPLR